MTKLIFQHFNLNPWDKHGLWSKEDMICSFSTAALTDTTHLRAKNSTHYFTVCMSEDVSHLAQLVL